MVEKYRGDRLPPIWDHMKKEIESDEKGSAQDASPKIEKQSPSFLSINVEKANDEKSILAISRQSIAQFARPRFSQKLTESELIEEMNARIKDRIKKKQEWTNERYNLYLAGETPLHNDIVRDGQHRRDFFIFPKQNLVKVKSRNG